MTEMISPLASFRKIIVKPRVGAWIVAIATIVLILVSIGSKVDSAQQQQATQQAADSAQSQLDKVASPVAAQCASDPSVRARLGDEVCAAAQQAAAPLPGPQGPTGAPGPTGSAGAEGRGVVATVIRADGHLIVTYTDGAKVDVGTVVGQNGANGKGIASSAVTDGRLVLTFSDGTTQDVGEIVGEKGSVGTSGAPGPAGRGIASTIIENDRLIVTYDDGTSTDAGPVPAGPPGADGADGRDGSPAATMTITLSNGSVVVCPRTGGDDASPAYTCTRQ